MGSELSEDVRRVREKMQPITECMSALGLEAIRLEQQLGCEDAGLPHEVWEAEALMERARAHLVALCERNDRLRAAVKGGPR